MLRRKGGFTTRIHVPTALQSLIGRREVWRSPQTDNAREARLRESIWQHHFSTLFVTLLRDLEAIELQLIEGDSSQTASQAQAMLPSGTSDVAIGVLARRLIEMGSSLTATRRVHDHIRNCVGLGYQRNMARLHLYRLVRGCASP
jgi:hypothetical protein